MHSSAHRPPFNNMSINYLTLAGALLNEQNSPFVINVIGHCMRPILESGDQVEVLPSAHYLPGDVVVFEHPHNGLTAHRMLGLTLSTRGFRYMTKADSSSVIDRMLEPHKVLGRSDRNLSQDRSIRPNAITRLSCIAQMANISMLLAFKKLLHRR
jgi:hypothetical protein